MKKYKANSLFTCVKLEKHDTAVSASTLYKCAKCNCEILFSEKDFYRYEMNRTTKFKDIFSDSVEGKDETFLEFQCPKCNIKTRINFGVYYGDKFPVIFIDSVLTE